MKAVFPGQPQATLHALSTASWNGTRIIAYISGNALIILGGHNELLQTIAHEADQQLTAVAINSESGKIATCTASEVFIYKSYGDDADDLKWFLQHTYTPTCRDDALCTLSWVEMDELLLGGSHLTILIATNAVVERWTKKIANRAKFAAFHYDASIVASIGWSDRLVKIWRRNFLSDDTERFDATYLLHPAVVTCLWWRGKPPGEEHADPVLYTMCADNKLRVWTTLDPHGLQALQLWVELDLSSCAQPPEPLSPSIPGNRYVAVMDSWHFKTLVEQMPSPKEGDERAQYTRERIQEIASKDPEICFVFDNDGNLSAWGLERVGSKARHLHEVFNIAHGKRLALQKHSFERGQAFFQGQCFGIVANDVSVNFLLHSSMGRIECFDSVLEKLFDPSSTLEEYTVQGVWTGHSKPIEKLELQETGSGAMIVSHAAHETLRWDVTSQRHALSLRHENVELLSNGIDGQVHLNSSHVKHNGFEVTHHNIDIRKKAVIGDDGSSFTIWDVDYNLLEYIHLFKKHETIQHLRWVSAAPSLQILAVSLINRILVFIPLHFDYTSGRQSWKCFREISIRHLTTLPVADLIWLPGGDLLVAAGNQLFLFGPDADKEDELLPDLLESNSKLESHNVLEVARHLNRLTPRFHPQTLLYHVLLGHVPMVHKILYALHNKLKFFTEGEELESQLGFPVFRDLSSESNGKDFETTPHVDEDIGEILTERLKSTALPSITKLQQKELQGVVQCIGSTAKQLSSVDESGMIYLIFLQRYRLQQQKLTPDSKGLPWREIMWAYLSTSEEILLDLTSRRYQGKMLWQDAKECGVFMWMTDIESLRNAFENIARNEYTKTDEKNPIDCSLHYIALRKKQVLQGLWRMATWNREQKATARLLANNFDDPRWQTAALKNAYALMGLRRFQYAAAFFLLADHLKDAVNVLLNQAEDMQLAVAVARVYEGDGGPVLREVLRDKILPRAVAEGNRWLAAWAFCMLNQRHMALQALIKPLESLVDVKEPLAQHAKSFYNFDPAMLTLYRIIRDELQSNRKTFSIGATLKEESDFVLRNAKILCRMGCDVLALDLVRNWKFMHTQTGLLSSFNTMSLNAPVDGAEEVEGEDDDDEEVPNSHFTLDGVPVKRIVVTEEPSAGSILDNFDF